MQINRNRISQLLRNFEFETLWIEELGWDRHTQRFNVTVDEIEFLLTAIAHKRGMVVFLCAATPDGTVPDRQIRRKIQREVARSVHEHLIIFTDTDETTQIWQRVKRDPGNVSVPREHRYHRGQSGEALIQKLRTIAFSLDEEEDLTLMDVIRRVDAAFNVEGVTKRFYERFKTEHARFLGFLEGIPDQVENSRNGEMKRWYASVMLNRLMFIYFIQKKDFLNDDPNYLRTKLRESQLNGADRYYTDFLCPLFFEGFAKPVSERSRQMGRLLGKVPYLNGGIFQRHQIEEIHGETIQIADAAFEQLFSFFEQYQWHLDERPFKDDNEIDPDVLGYIFEKYINQKEMGAYYTQEDITEYISKNTIIPSLFDTARKRCRIAFEGDASVWQLLRDDSDRYIYDAVKTGTALDLPEDIAVGINDASRRGQWNTLAPDEYANSTEIWREVVARRERYKAIHSKLSNGDIDDINALITHNLNIHQFAQDVIENCEGPELLRAFWKAITQVTILDPTCGSGAFLFAALNILEPLYEACLDRMEVFLEELEHTHENTRTERYRDFRKVLEDIDQHPNRRYFILKSIIINNLYGVDVMEEAIEICKLRLFLKMVAQIEDVEQIEPLPDIDFNIQVGNTLVGYTTYNEVKTAITENRIDFDNTMQRIEEKAEDVEHLFEQFRLQQTELGGAVTPDDKQVLQDKLKVLEDELNLYLAGEYGVDLNRESAYQNWLFSHKPFHWFIEFYGILKHGGFDVIIGNPPYVEYSRVREDYTVRGYETEGSGNLYSMTIERSIDLSKGPVGMIVQLPLVCTDRMIPVQSLFRIGNRKSWFANFDDRPGKLFDDLQHIRATIFISIKEKNLDTAELYATQYKRWFTETRSILFEDIVYEDITEICFEGSFPKIGDSVGKRIATTLRAANRSILNFRTGQFPCYFHNSPQYWIRATDFVPYFWNEQDGERISTQVRPLYLTTELDARVVVATLNSSLFYWWFIILSDCRHLNLREIRNFPIGIDRMEEAIKHSLSGITADLMTDLRRHARRRETYYQTTGRVVYDEFYPRYSKPIIDEIDRLLAQHYELTPEELDFIINYDIKYRMGLGSD